MAGKTVEAGYGGDHQAERARWEPVVAAGHAYCHEPVCVQPGGRWIRPGSAWNLSHTPDKSAYLGPSHARCNSREAGIRGNPRRRPRPDQAPRWRPTRQW